MLIVRLRAPNNTLLVLRVVFVEPFKAFKHIGGLDKGFGSENSVFLSFGSENSVFSRAGIDTRNSDGNRPELGTQAFTDLEPS